MRILIAEDEETQREALANILKRRGHEVIAVSDGVDATHQLVYNGYFDLVITDNSMVKMSGLELLKYMRDDPGFSEIPVIVISSEDIEQAAKGWNARYLAKPVSKVRLLQLMAEVKPQGATD